jgi:two-component system, OmpR family, sensor histidine kinase KdpD
VPGPRSTAWSRSARPTAVKKQLTGVLASAAAVVVVTGVVAVLRHWVPVLSLAMLYLFAVLPIAVGWGLAYGIGVSIASMLAFNFFFLAPVHTFRIDDSRNWLALIVFVATAAVVSELATRSRRRASEASRLAEEATALVEERERLAAEALDAEALRRADVIKTALLRAVSHDLRTPLMAISTSAGALARSDLSIDEADRQELLQTILAASNRLAHLVGNLLDLSRLEAGAAQPEPQVVEVEELVAAALDELGEAGERIEVSLPEGSPLVRVDAHQIQRVLVNLFENALKYSSQEEPVRVIVAANSSEAVVRVIDHGPGVGPQDRERIFEAFQRGIRKGDEPGAGLGLAIARGFAEANGGNVAVESLRGQGATFVLSLPVERTKVLA